MFSIVIPLYNKESSIGRTLESVLSQRFSDFEIIVVNDGSTDSSLLKVQEFKDSRIKLINQNNGGVSKARNCGIENSSRDWIVFLDADDLWMEDHLCTLNTAIAKYPDIFVFCNSYSRTEFKFNESVDIAGEEIIHDYFKEGLKSFFFWTGVVCIHKSVFNKVGGFDERLSRGEDLDLWNRIGRLYSIVKSNRITAIYKQDSENKLTRSKVELNKCFENYLDFEGKSVSEKIYLRMLAKAKILSLIKQLEMIAALKLIVKYNLKLF